MLIAVALTVLSAGAVGDDDEKASGCAAVVYDIRTQASAQAELVQLGVPLGRAKEIARFCVDDRDEAPLLRAVAPKSGPLDDVTERVITRLLIDAGGSAAGDAVTWQITKRLTAADAALVDAALGEKADTWVKALALAPDDPERLVCTAAKLIEEKRADEAQKLALPSFAEAATGGVDVVEIAQRRRMVAAVRARLAAARGDLVEAGALVAELRPDPRLDEIGNTVHDDKDGKRVPKSAPWACRVDAPAAACAVVAAFVDKRDFAGAVAFDAKSFGHCGSAAARANVEMKRPFDAYVALAGGSYFDRDAGSVPSDPVASEKLLEELGEPALAERHAEDAVRSCNKYPPGAADRDGALRCATLKSYADDLRTRNKAKRELGPSWERAGAQAAQVAKVKLMDRLARPGIAQMFKETAAPKGAAHKKARVDVPGVDVIYAAVEPAPGKRAFAVALSRDLDPRGEVSGGGVVLYVSRDGAKTWDGPFPAGFAVGFPFMPRTTTTAPAFDGDDALVPVDVYEIDADKIVFPPIGLEAKRHVNNRVLRVPLAVLTRDSDGDGLTDLTEERLATDADAADSDGDGVPDAFDQAPLTGPASSAADALRAKFLDVALKKRAPPAAIVEGPSAPVRPVRPELRTSFVVADFAFSGSNGERVIAMPQDAWDAYSKKLGPVYPMEIEVIVSPDKHRAVVDMNEGWRGETLLVEEKADGTFTTRELSSWIT